MLASLGVATAAQALSPLLLEAEDGELNGTSVMTAVAGYSGDGYVGGFDTATDSVTITIPDSPGGLTEVVIRYAAPHGQKIATLRLNGQGMGEVTFTPSDTFTTVSAGKVLLQPGDNTLTIVNNWGWYLIDSIMLTPASDPGPHQVTGDLVNPDADEGAKALMRQLTANYGKNILSGQQDMASIEWLESAVGKSPAVAGLDMMDYSPSRVERGTVGRDVDRALAWHERGGIVTFVWHWNAPSGLIDQQGKEWWRGFYTDATTFDVAAALEDKSSADYRLLIRDIDAIAKQLQRLEDAGVPVLWRPLHEAEGGWFWWGAKGAAPAKELWRTMYDRLTEHHGLDNLIWVWNSAKADWYPGDDVVDVVSIDSYPQQGDHGPVATSYAHLVDLVDDRKLVAMTENSAIPDPDLLQAYHADWSWFTTWSGGFIDDGQINPRDFLQRVYNHDYVITLDELDEWRAAGDGTSTTTTGTTSTTSTDSTTSTTSTSTSTTPTTSTSTSTTPTTSTSTSSTPTSNTWGTTSTSSSSMVSGLTCSVTTTAWYSGYQLYVTVENNGPPVAGWTVRLDFAEPPQFVTGWNARLTPSGNTITATNVEWNGNLATGKSASFGVQGGHDGSFIRPTCTVPGGTQSTTTSSTSSRTTPTTSSSTTRSTTSTTSSTTTRSTTTSTRSTTTSTRSTTSTTTSTRTTPTTTRTTTTSTRTTPTTTRTTTTSTRTTPTRTTTSTTPTRTTTTSSSGGNGIRCHVKSYVWDSGYQLEVTVVNYGPVVGGWTIELRFAEPPQMTGGWNANLSASGNTVQASNLSWNGQLAAEQSATFGMQGKHDGSFVPPLCVGPGGTTSPSTSTSTSATRTSTSVTSTGTTSTSTSPTSTSTTSTSPTSTSTGDPRVDNPYLGQGYVNPEWKAKADGDPGGDRVSNTPTAVWLDRIAAVHGDDSTGKMGLRDHLDEALEQGADYIQFVLYNLPARDCTALASDGELNINELNRYQAEFIDPIAEIQGDPKYASLRIINVVEVDALANMALFSAGGNATAVCAQVRQEGTYVQGIQYALGKLGPISNVYNYLDAAQHGWLGYDDNFTAAAQLLANVAKGAPGGVNTVTGFITNARHYFATVEPYLEVTEQTRQSKWLEWNSYADEQSFAQAFRAKLVSLGMPSSIGMLIDTSRNGWGGPDRPTAAVTTGTIDEQVDGSRIDRRIHPGNWCNQAGAGLGERPTAEPASGIDAYVWVKPPGESDGSSRFDRGTGYDRMCDPAYGGNSRNGYNPTGALPDSPAAGAWFSAQFAELMDNAHPPLSPSTTTRTTTSSTSSTSTETTTSSTSTQTTTTSTSPTRTTTTSTSPTSTTPSTTRTPGPRVDNPYLGQGYVNPEWKAKADGEPGGDRVSDTPTAVWIDRVADIHGSGSSGPMSMVDHLDEALAQGADYIQFAIYNLPARDCTELASDGEFAIHELNRYQSEFIDPIAELQGDPKYASLRIINVVEFHALPSIALNVFGSGTFQCDLVRQEGTYVQGIQYALGKLGAISNVYNYLDAAHHGWLGWDENFNISTKFFADVVKGAPGGVDTVAGIITNTADYSATVEPFLEVTNQTRQSAWIEWNSYVDELSFAQAFRAKLVSLGLPASIGMLIDTSRNGWGGPDRPTAAVTTGTIDQQVNGSRIDRRFHIANWCNQAGAGLGERPTAEPAPGIDAYVWVKPPGESDGLAGAFPNRMCDPTFSGNARNGFNPTGALPNAPAAGEWFSTQFAELMDNAYPPLD